LNHYWLFLHARRTQVHRDPETRASGDRGTRHRIDARNIALARNHARRRRSFSVALTGATRARSTTSRSFGAGDIARIRATGRQRVGRRSARWSARHPHIT